MYWAIFGIFHSIFRAAYAEVNRLHNVDNWQLSFIQAVVAILLLLPLIPFMYWPAEPNFYLAALMVALILSVGTVIQLNLTTMKKGRTSSVAIPLEAFAAFAIWVGITPYAMDAYIGNPMMTVCVLASFVLATAALFYVRGTDFSWESLFVVAPVGITFAVAGVVTKLVVPTTHIIPACLSFVLMNYAVMTLVLGVFTLCKRKASKDMVAAPMLKAGVLTGICALTAYASFVMSVVYAPNPAYTSILAALVPVWLMWYHEMRYIEDKANPLAGLLIVAAVLLLIAASWN